MNILARVTKFCLMALAFISVSHLYFSPIVSAKTADENIKAAYEYYKNNKTDPSAYEGLGWAYIERFETQGNSKDVSKAIKIFDKSVEKFGGTASIFYSLGAAHFNLGKLSQSESYYKKALSIDKNNLPSQLGLGNVYQTQGQFKKAYSHYKKAKAIQNDNPFVSVTLAQLAFEMGMYAKAVKYADQALVANPIDIFSYLIVAKSYRYLGQDERSIEILNKVLKFDELNPQIYLDLAWSHFNLNEYDSAKKFAFKYNSLAPNSGHGYKLLAGIFKKTGKVDRMQNSARRAEGFYLKESKSQPAKRYTSLAWLYLEFLDNPQKALELAEKNFSMKKTADDQTLLGWAQFKNDLLEGALDNYKKAVKLNSTIAENWYRLGLIHKKLGQSKHAAKAWKKGLKLGPKTWHLEMNEELLLLNPES
ncbi:MAG: tetratricopeptide repeat protein [Nitrospinales bacterium]